MFSHGSMLMLLMHESCSFVTYAINQILVFVVCLGIPSFYPDMVVVKRMLR